ncbi:MAG: hypothetical protein NVS3B19_15850 [Ginsengibacter sp.]
MAYENNEKKNDSVYSTRIRAGKRRTYFFDVRETRGNDFYLTITESRKKFNDDGYDRHKIFLYKEDFNKFLKGLSEAIEYVKTDLMPDFDFDAFNHDTPYEGDNQMEGRSEGENNHVEAAAPEVHEAPVTEVKTEEFNTNHNDTTHEEVDKW